MQILYIEQNFNRLNFVHSPLIYESRGISVEKIIRDSVFKNSIKNNFAFYVNTDDAPLSGCPTPTYFFSTTNNDFDNCFPCFLFDSWPEIGIENYTNTISNFITTKPLSNKVGWIGSPMSMPRQIFCNRFNNTYFTEAIINNWNRNNPKALFSKCPTYLTLQEQINKWKYLIDFEGAGWSARTKILLNSPRIIFIVDRPYKEFWYKDLVPWKHYVPIKRDLSDLEKNYDKIESDIFLQNYISEEQKKFSKKFLSYNSALEQATKIITKNLI